MSAGLVDVRPAAGSETIDRYALREFEDALDRAVNELIGAFYDAVPAEYFDVELDADDRRIPGGLRDADGAIDDAVHDFEWTLNRELARLRARKGAQ
jgi:hypothetical protein